MVLKMPNYLKLIDKLPGNAGQFSNFLDYPGQVFSDTKKGFVRFCQENKEFHYLN
jgi:hypothetical protein